MKKSSFFLVLICSLTFCVSYSQNNQKPVIKFGDIKPEDFAPKAYEVDSSASAIVLADIGSSKFETNEKGFFSIVFRHHKRIRVMNKTGFDEASVSITVYKNGDSEESLEGLEAVTYNLEDNKVVATKLEKSSIFKDKINKYYTTKKFTFPNLKEGSIIEFKYKIVSTLFQRLRGWEFQGAMPRIWTQYEVTNPSLFDYMMHNQGSRNFDSSDVKKTNAYYNIFNPYGSGSFSWNGDDYYHIWGMKNVPALKKESFTTTTDNYVQKIEFQLKAINWPNGKVDNILNTWDKLSERLLKDEDFGEALEKNNSFLTEEIDKVIAGTKDNYQKAKRIYEYVRNNFTCTDHDRIWMSNSLKKTFQEKSGNVADINLLLTAIYKGNGFVADPLILSTRENGRAYELYPILSKFNYVICRLKVDSQYILLDASNNLAFGKLDESVYNGYARMINKMPVLIDLSPDSVNEVRLTSVFLFNDEHSNKIGGTFTSKLGDFESLRVRKKIQKGSINDYLSELKKFYPADIEVSDIHVDSLKTYDEPLSIAYNVSFSPDSDIFYFNPMLSQVKKENPFKSATREYPVEMPYKTDDIYILNMEIPKGYKVEELPKSIKVELNDADGFFEYIIDNDASAIHLRSRIVINKATFSNDDYTTLRDFFGYIVKKHSEQIVLKKIK